VVEEIRRLPEQNVFFPGVRSYVGFRQTGINVDRPARTNGPSRIRIGRRVAGALDGIFAFSNVPLRLAAWMGFVVAALAGALGLMFVYYRIFTDVPVRGFTALMTVLLFLGGVQLLSLGIIGEYLGRIYNEVKGRPRYHVEERLNIGAEPPRDQAPSVQRSEESPNGR
jgi:dolichol-phosphate mannosyltransferase